MEPFVNVLLVGASICMARDPPNLRNPSLDLKPTQAHPARTGPTQDGTPGGEQDDPYQGDPQEMESTSRENNQKGRSPCSQKGNGRKKIQIIPGTALVRY